MRSRYKSIYELPNKVKIETTTGENCAELPNNKTKVMTEFYPALGKIVITESNLFKKAKHCKNADSLKSCLMKQKEKVKRKAPATKKKTKKTDIADADVDIVEKSMENIEPLESDYDVIDLETGELFSCRTSKSLHLTWITVAKQILASYKWDKCLFITCTMASRPDYNEMNHLATGFVNRLKKQFRDDFQGIHKFLEPCDDGSWHVHYIACFHQFPETFEKWAKRWWALKQGYKSDIQVFIRKFNNKEDLINTIKYLDPTSTKKAHRVPFYPKNCQCMRGYGDYAMPTTAISYFEVAKKIVGQEDPTKRKNIRVIDADTGVQVYYRIEYCFTANIVAQNKKHHSDIKANKPTEKQMVQISFVDEMPKRNTELWQDYKYTHTMHWSGI